MKFGRKDIQLAFKTGTDANKAKFKKECVQGEIYHATDTGFFYVAEVTAGANDATLSQFGATPFANQYSVSFDGSNDYASVNGDSHIQLHDNFTISAWFRTGSTVTSNGGIIGWGQPAVGKFRGFGLNSSNQLVFNAYGRFYNPTGATALSANTWYHGLLTVTAISGQNNTATVYINGSQDSQITSGVLAYSYSSTNVAQSYYGGSERFLGHIDELSLFNSVLSATDIATIYNGGNGPADIKGLNPVAWWRMGDGTENASGTTVYDMSDNSNNLTLYNIASPNGFVSGTGNTP